MGYFIVEEPERLDLWLGSVKDCSYYAALKGINPHTIRVLDHADKAVGYHCPLRIHLCGKWWAHEHCKDIKYYFDRMAHAKSMDIEFVTEK